MVRQSSWLTEGGYLRAFVLECAHLVRPQQPGSSGGSAHCMNQITLCRPWESCAHSATHVAFSCVIWTAMCRVTYLMSVYDKERTTSVEELHQYYGSGRSWRWRFNLLFEKQKKKRLEVRWFCYMLVLIPLIFLFSCLYKFQIIRTMCRLALWINPRDFFLFLIDLFFYGNLVSRLLMWFYHHTLAFFS